MWQKLFLNQTVPELTINLQSYTMCNHTIQLLYNSFHTIHELGFRMRHKNTQTQIIHSLFLHFPPRKYCPFDLLYKSIAAGMAFGQSRDGLHHSLSEFGNKHHLVLAESYILKVTSTHNVLCLSKNVLSNKNHPIL